jgi:hypothetical protein
MHSSEYQTAHVRYADIRRRAYEEVVRFAIDSGIASGALRLSGIDRHTLSVWRLTWRGEHPSGDGGWDWERVSWSFRRRPAAFHVAIWNGERLCGLAVGRLSAKRAGGVRHTLSVHYMESAPETDNPFAGMVALLVVSAARTYGRMLGASRLRLVNPLPGVLPLYERLGFTVAQSGGRPVYCEQEIKP